MNKIEKIIGLALFVGVLSLFTAIFYLAPKENVGSYQPNPRAVSFQSHVETSLTATTTATTIVSSSIPQNVLGANGSINVYFLASTTNSADIKTIAVSFGGTTFCSNTASGSQSWQGTCTISNRNATGSQISAGSMIPSPTASTTKTGTVDTTASQTIAIVGTLASTTSAISIEDFIVIVNK